MRGSEVPPRRASDADRDRVVRVLRDAAVDGRLSQDSFVHRIDLALRARDHASLAEVVADLPLSRRGVGRLEVAITSLADKISPASKYPPLRLPGRGARLVVIGRRADCDVVVRDPTVSRVHAVLALSPAGWVIEDRGSTNGTRINGRRIWGMAAVRAGDRVGLGGATFRLVRPEL